MLSRLFLVLILTVSTFSFAEPQATVEVYKLRQKDDLKFAYGSGLAFKKSSPYGKGSKYFYLFPSGDYLITDGRDKRSDLEIPHLAVAKLKKKKFEITERFPIYFPNQQEMLVDLEGVSAAPNQQVWLADEKSSSLIQVDMETGAIETVLSPESGLPAILKQSEFNRGLESVTVAPDGTVYTAIQSPLTFAGDALTTSSFVRLIAYDPALQTTKTFAIPFDPEIYVSRDEVKIGDLQVIDNNRLLMIEQGMSKQGMNINRIFEIEIGAASDLSGRQINGQELEYYVGDLFKEHQIVPVAKKLLVDLNDLGWKYRKAEGLALVDAYTLAVTNDWDDESNLTKTELWMIELSNPLFGWSWKEWSLFIILFLVMLFSSALTLVFVFKGTASNPSSDE